MFSVCTWAVFNMSATVKWANRISALQVLINALYQFKPPTQASKYEHSQVQLADTEGTGVISQLGVHYVFELQHTSEELCRTPRSAVARDC